MYLCQLLQCLLRPGFDSYQRPRGFRFEDVDEIPIDAVGHQVATVDHVSPSWIAGSIGTPREPKDWRSTGVPFIGLNSGGRICLASGASLGGL